jgi:hypothetical protein
MLLILAGGLFLWAGCEGRPSLIPVSDPDLKRTSAQFAADAAKRTYPASAPHGGDAEAMADVDYGIRNRIQIENLSSDNWDGVELWVNEKYVVSLPNWPAKGLKKVNFAMLYDRDGQSFPINNKTTHVDKIEIFKNGKLYNVPKRLTD